jgi:hypothetical protein
MTYQANNKFFLMVICDLAYSLPAISQFSSQKSDLDTQQAARINNEARCRSLPKQYSLRSLLLLRMHRHQQLNAI